MNITALIAAVNDFPRQDTVKFFALKYVLGCLISVLCGVVGVVCVLTRSVLTVTVSKKDVHIYAKSVECQYFFAQLFNT